MIPGQPGKCSLGILDHGLHTPYPEKTEDVNCQVYKLTEMNGLWFGKQKSVWKQGNRKWGPSTKKQSRIEYQNQSVMPRSEEKLPLGLKCKSVKKQDDFFPLWSWVTFSLLGTHPWVMGMTISQAVGGSGVFLSTTPRPWGLPERDQLSGPVQTTLRHTLALPRRSQYPRGLVTHILPLASWAVTWLLWNRCPLWKRRWQ